MLCLFFDTTVSLGFILIHMAGEHAWTPLFCLWRHDSVIT
ncbi:hypothetical protein MIDIC_160016 [Alphaproteobacteria bacterium]